MGFDREKNKGEESAAMGEIIKFQRTEDVAGIQTVLDNIETLKAVGVSKVQDAQYADKTNLAKSPAAVKSPYDLPSNVINNGGLPLPEFARNLMAKRRIQKLALRPAA